MGAMTHRAQQKFIVATRAGNATEFKGIVSNGEQRCLNEPIVFLFISTTTTTTTVTVVLSRMPRERLFCPRNNCFREKKQTNKNNEEPVYTYIHIYIYIYIYGPS